MLDIIGSWTTKKQRPAKRPYRRRNQEVYARFRFFGRPSTNRKGRYRPRHF